ncbi:MAG: hypothetical protein V4550_01670 [Gemmatimonadota bacterium]
MDTTAGSALGPVDTLIVETVTWTPALEIGGEIAITRAVAGQRVAVCVLALPNPDDAPRFPFLEKTRLWTRDHKIRQLTSGLTRFGVEIIRIPTLGAGELQRVEAYASGTPTTYEELRGYRYGAARLGESVAASLTHVAKHASPDLVRLCPLLQSYFRLGAMTFEMTKALLAALRPVEIITYNGRYAAGGAVAEAARLCGVPLLYHEQGSTMDRYELFRERPQDPRFVQSEIRRYWEAAGPERRAVAADPVRADPPHNARRRIVFFTTNDFEQEYTGREHSGIFPTQRDAVAHLARWASTRSDVDFIVREHPDAVAGQPSDRAWLDAIASLGTQVVRSEEQVDDDAFVRQADVVVTAGTDIGLLAAAGGRPSIVVEEAFYSGFGCVYEPHSVTELEALLDDKRLPELPSERCSPAMHWLATFGTPMRYYEPTTLYSGRFLGAELSGAPRWLVRTGIGSLARLAWRRLRPSWISQQRPART